MQLSRAWKTVLRGVLLAALGAGTAHAVRRPAQRRRHRRGERVAGGTSRLESRGISSGGPAANGRIAPGTNWKCCHRGALPQSGFRG